MQVIDDLSVCVDCAMFIANGDLTGLDYAFDEKEADERQAAILAGISKETKAGGHWVMSGDENEESSFSRSACDCCDTSLGGDRLKAAVIYPNQKDENQ